MRSTWTMNLFFLTVGLFGTGAQAADFFLHCEGQVNFDHTREIRKINFAMSVPFDPQNREFYQETTIQYDQRVSDVSPAIDNTPGIDYTREARAWDRGFDGTYLSFSHADPKHPERRKTLLIDTRKHTGDLFVPEYKQNPAKHFAMTCEGQFQ